MNYVLFDDVAQPRLLPFTHTRPVADIRCGILTMRERWELCLQQATASLTENHLTELYPFTEKSDNTYINGAVFGNHDLLKAIYNLQQDEMLISGDIVIAVRIGAHGMGLHSFLGHISALPATHYEGDVLALRNIWDIFTLNDRAIRSDFVLLTKDKKSAPVPDGVFVTSGENLFIEEGAHIYPGCIINATTGPVYIAKNAEVLEGAMMRGPLAVCEHAVIKMGAKIYGATTIGPGSKVGGEINNAVFFANSNKAHDGYLGNAVIGEWCNLGADTNCSNLKNNYAQVKIWDEAANRSVDTGLTFCGLFMGDHSKCGINTMFNTGTVVGISCNIFGGGFPEKYVRSFTWGGSEGISNYDFNRAMETASRMMERRGRKLSHAETEMYRHVFNKVKENFSTPGIL